MARTEVRYAVPSERPRKGRPQQIGSLIPEAARTLGFEAELALAQQATLLTNVLNEVAPHLAKRCRMVGSERGRLIVEADDRAAAQELHLRGTEVASAYTQRGGELRALGLSVRLVNLGSERIENE